MKICNPNQYIPKVKLAVSTLEYRNVCGKSAYTIYNIRYTIYDIHIDRDDKRETIHTGLTPPPILSDTPVSGMFTDHWSVDSIAVSVFIAILVEFEKTSRLVLWSVPGAKKQRRLWLVCRLGNEQQMALVVLKLSPLFRWRPTV